MSVAIRYAACIAGLLVAADLNAGTLPEPDPGMDNPRFLALILENDNYVPPRQDRHYTNGIFLSYGFPKGYQSKWSSWLGRLTPLADEVADREYDIALGQNLYTPESFASPDPAPNDRPFAGWLYGEISVTTHAPGVEEHLAVNLGVVGPAALGETTQKLIHNVSGDRGPLGWRHQLDNEPALSLRYRRSWFMPLMNGEDLESDLVSRAGLTIGNVVTESGVGAMLRLGSFLFERDIPQRLQPGLSGNSTRFDNRAGRFDWFVFAGAQGRAVLHNLFLDGSTFKDSLSVDRRVLVWDGSTGISFSFGHLSRPVMFTFSFVWRGKEFDEQRELDEFGSAQFAHAILRRCLDGSLLHAACLTPTASETPTPPSRTASHICLNEVRGAAPRCAPGRKARRLRPAA